MTDPPDVRLPESFAESGDPQDSNPFPAGDPRYDVWEEATREAEEEVCRINEDALGGRKSFGDWVLNPVHPHDGLLEVPVAKFDVWARRYIKVVWTDAQVASYDQWLLNYANAWLDVLARRLDESPPPFSVEEALIEARNRLGNRVQFWKGEGRRYRAEQQAHAAASEPQKKVATKNLQRRRRLLVQAHRREHGLTAEGFALGIGLSNSAVRGIVREDWTRFSEATRDKLLRVLGVTVDEWYRE